MTAAQRPDDVSSLQRLLDRVLDEQKSSWDHGERVPVESYLNRYPELGRDAEAVLDLIYQEILLRRARGEPLDPDEFVARFPMRCESLVLQFAVDGAIGSEPGSTTTDRSSNVDEQERPKTIAGYEVLGVLGRGGMGVVYKARDEKLARLVAIKIMRPELASSPEAMKRFQREARATAALSHDHVVTIHQVGEEAGVPFLVMPLLHGFALDERLKREERMAVREVMRVMRETAEGLATAHERGLVHRDVKPANIWLEAPRGRVKILDFGLAHTAAEFDATLTQTGVVLGSPAYMAPEQAMSDPVDHRSDLYSLGAVAYHMAAGRPPFEGRSISAILAALLRDEPMHPSKHVPELPPALTDLILRLLAKDPAARPQSAQEVVEAIQAIEHDPSAPFVPAAAPASPPLPLAHSAQTLEPAPAPPPARRAPRRFAALLLALAALGGVGAVVSQVVALVKQKDGTATETKGTRVKVEDAGHVASFPARVAESSAPKTATPDGEPVRTENTVDYDDERKAAEWLLRQVAHGGGSFELEDTDGTPLGSFGAGSSPNLPGAWFVVVRVQLDGVSLTDDGLRHLAGCRRIRNADLSNNVAISARGLEALRGCRTLQRLNLQNTGVGDGLGGLLALWPELEQLSVLACGITDVTTRAWPDSSRLSYLQVGMTSISDEGLARIVARCPNLDQIHIETAPGTGTLPSIATLKPLRKLHFVSFFAHQITDDGLAVLADLPRLQHVWVGEPRTDQELVQIASLGEKVTILWLQNINYPDGQVTDAGLAAIARMQGLRNLDLTQGRLGPSDEFLAQLAVLPHLQLLTLQYDEAARRYTPEGIAAFRKQRPDVGLSLDDKDYPPRATSRPGGPEGNLAPSGR